MIFSSASSRVRPSEQSFIIWVAGDLSDCRFMDKRGVYVCGVQSRLSVHPAVIGENRVAGGMSRCSARFLR